MLRAPGLRGEKLILVAVKQIWVAIRLFPLLCRTNFQPFKSGSKDRLTDTCNDPLRGGGPSTYEPARAVNKTY